MSNCEHSSRFIVGKIPELPQMDEFYNIRIDSKEFIMDRKNLEQLKTQIEKALKYK